jgi:hypothetical protein
VVATVSVVLKGFNDVDKNDEDDDGDDDEVVVVEISIAI